VICLPLGIAANALRFHHQWLPDRIIYERLALSSDTIALLRANGHQHLDPSSVERDSLELEADTERVRKYIESTFAHRATRVAKVDAKTIGMRRKGRAKKLKTCFFALIWWVAGYNRNEQWPLRQQAIVGINFATSWSR